MPRNTSGLRNRRLDGTSTPDARLVNVRLTPGEIARLDAECKRLGVNRSDLIRGWIRAAG